MIQTNDDPGADVLHVRFGPENAAHDGAAEVAQGVFVAFDAHGSPHGVEVTSAQRRTVAGAARSAAAE